jgi:D-amino-acid dehydrogenase
MRLVVVGSGIVGAACAYTAAGLGAEVTLVDAGREGQATAAGAGIICPWVGSVEDPARYALSCAGARFYPELVAELGPANVSSYRRVGTLVAAGAAADLEPVRSRLTAWREQLPEIGDVELLTPGQAQQLFPPLAESLSAVLITGGARVDGRQLAAALVSAAVARGAVVRPGQAELRRDGDRVTGVRLDGEEVEADAVVAAAGAWTPALLAPAGLRVPVAPQRGQIVHLSLAPADTSQWPVLFPLGSDHYLLSFDDSRVVVGATRETGAGFDYRVTAAGLAQVLSQALAVAPGLGQATVLETRIGFRPASDGNRPLLGPVPGADGLLIATGLGATGLTIGPYAGALVARVALGLEPELDLAPFALR